MDASWPLVRGLGMRERRRVQWEWRGDGTGGGRPAGIESCSVVPVGLRRAFGCGDIGSRRDAGAVSVQPSRMRVSSQARVGVKEATMASVIAIGAKVAAGRSWTSAADAWRLSVIEARALLVISERSAGGNTGSPIVGEPVA